MKTISDLFERVNNVRKRLGISKADPWYRGHPCGDWALLPGILRRTNGLRHERNMYAEFKNMSGEETRKHTNPWELLAVMQHYGMPTRFLDWTEDLNVALFFALQGRIDQPCIWILNPFRLNKQSTDKALIYDSADTLDIDYYDAVCKKKSWPYSLPVALARPWTNDRLVHQRGSFTFHGNDTAPLDESCSDCLKRVAIPPELVRGLGKYLRQTGIDAFRLFPDLTGLSRSLRNKYRFT